MVSHCGGSVDGRFATGKRDISCRTGRRAGQLLAGESRLYLWFYYRHYGPPAIIYRKHRDCGTTRHAKTDNEQRRLTYAIMGRRAAG